MRKLFTLLIALLFVAASSWAQTTIICTGTAGSYKSGSVSSAGVKNDGNMITINSSENRGWATYDLTALAGATVTAVTAHFTTYTSTSSSATNNLYGFTGDPATMAGAALYTACGAGTSFSAAAWTANALNTMVLNATGIAFVNTYAGGLINIGYVRGSTNTYNIYGYSGTTPPDLVITYTGGGPCSGTPNPGNTISSANPVCSGSGFTLSLQNATTGSGVIYQWQTSPDGNDPWTNVGTSISTYAATQTIATWYRCKVTCDVNPTATSTPVYVTMNSFLNCYCSSIPTNTADEEIYSVTVNGATNAYNCTTVAPGPGSILNEYSNFFPLGSLTNLPRTTTINFTILEDECDGASYYNNGCSMWVDFNQNGSFADAGEQVYVETTTTISPRTITGSFVVPVGAVLGQTAMRIIVAEGISGTGFVPCLSYGYGETEDYIVTITEAPACIPPNTLTATGITGFEATIGWTEGGTATSWDVEWGPNPFTPTGTPNLPGLTSNSHLLTGLTPVTGYTFYVRANCGGGLYSTWSGPKTFTTTVACPAPTALGASAITPTSATLGWTSTGTLFDIEWGLSSFTPTGTPNLTGVTNPYVLGSLTPATSYKYYVRQDCGVNGYSTWSGPYTFATTCLPIVSLPWMEGFEGLTTVGTNILPTCWSYLNLTSSNYSCNGTCNSNTAHSGSKFIGGSWSFNVWDFTPGITLTAGTSYTFSYWFKCTDATIGYDVSLAYGTSPDVASMVNVLNTETGLNIATWTLRTFNFTPAANGVYYFGLHNNCPTSAPNGIGFDDFMLEPTPLCAAPTALTATDLTETIAFLGWTPGGTEISWDVEWGPAGFIIGTGTRELGVTGNPYKLQGLNPSTTYSFYVRANCTGGGNSSFTGPYTFTTLGIPPCAIAVSPLNGATGILSTASLNWTSGGGAPTGYKLYFGKSSPPAYVGDLGLVTTWTPPVPMDWVTVYYWKVVPYSGSGDAVGCTEWSFTTAQVTYCASGATNTADEEIYGVTVNGVTNAYSCTTVAPGPGSILNRYSNFTTLGSMFSLPVGATSTFTVEENECDGASFYAFGTSIWIDFNQNGLFTDAGEQVFLESATALGPRNVVGSFIVPPGTALGTTRMRVTVSEGNAGTSLTPCLSYGYGETEDYTVTIAPPPDHDVGTASIDDVPASILIGSVITPKATVTNYGLNAEVFDVTMTITGGYTSTVTGVSLAVGASTQVTFANWTPALGTYTVQACTQLVGDMVPTNNCKSKTTMVTAAAWTAGSAFPTGTYMGTGVGYTDNSVTPPVGYLFSFGGNTNSALGTECYKYNVNTDTWTTIASLPAKRVVMTSALQGNYIYVIGGSDGTVYVNTVYRYDIALDTWTTLTSTLPKTIAWGKAVAYGTNYIYLAGGIDAATSGVVIPDVYVYDIALDTWTAATSMPGPKFGGAFSRTGDKLVYVAGADLSVISNLVYVGTIAAGNPLSISWTTAKSPYPGTIGEPVYEYVQDPASTIASHSEILNNRIAYPGGTMYRFDGAPWGTNEIIVAAGSPTASWVPAVPNPCYSFNPTTDTWTMKPDVPVAVLGASTGSVDLNNAGTHTWKLILASGYTGTSVTTATQILTETISPSAPLAVTGIVTNVTGCYGNTNGSIITTVTGGTAPYTYSWSNLATTANLTGIGAGTYTVTVSDAASGHVIESWNVTQPVEMVLTGVPANAACPTSHDGAINLTVAGGAAGYTYLWSNLATTEDLAGLNPGTYTVTVTDGNLCVKTGNWTVGQTNAVCPNITVTGEVTTTVCYNATNTITVAGGTTLFTVVAPNGNATFIAGVNILFEPGTSVQSGAYMHGYISTTYCTNPSSPIVASETGKEEPQTGLSMANFNLYPNPTNGNFTLLQKGERTFGTVKVEVFSMNGTKVLTEQMVGEMKHEFRFSSVPAGLYFVKVVADDYVETIKLIKTR